MGGKVMPFVIISDSKGEVISRHVGYNPGDEKKLEKEIVHLLALMNGAGDSTKIPDPAINDPVVKSSK